MLAKKKRRFPDIDPRSWEHPADKAALATLRQLKGFDELVKGFFSITTEKSLRLMALASSVKVTPTQYPRIHAIRAEVVDTFDWPRVPDIFVTQSPFMNAGVLGVDDPFIVLNSSTLKVLDDDELSAIVAHELGHVMSGHALYKTLIWLVTKLAASALPIPAVVFYAVYAALMEWDRKSELSADRAEVLAIQDPEPSSRLLMKISGGEDLSQVNLEDFRAQAREYDESNTLADSVHKLLNTLWLSHPVPVIRLKELEAWAASPQYETILDGNYIRRDYRTDSTAEDIRNGFESYKREMRESGDPLAGFAADVADHLEKVAAGFQQGFEELAKNAGSLFGNLFGPQGTQTPTKPDAPTDGAAPSGDAEPDMKNARDPEGPSGA